MEWGGEEDSGLGGGVDSVSAMGDPGAVRPTGGEVPFAT